MLLLGLALTLAFAAVPGTAEEQRGWARVHVYRHQHWTENNFSPSFYCDDAVLARIDNGSWFSFDVTAGKHRFRASDEKAVLSLDLAAGREYFLLVEFNSGSFKGKSYVVPVERGVAAKDLAEAKALKAHKLLADAAPAFVRLLAPERGGDWRTLPPMRTAEDDLERIQITSERRPLLAGEVPVAVMDLDALEVEASTARSVSDMLRNRLAGGGVRLVDRTRLAQILKEQNIQHSDRSNSLLAVRLGRILNVSKMVFGSISKLGTHMTVSVQVLDVETSGIDGIREVLCRRCTPEDMPEAVAKLAGTLIAAK